jgi:ribosomal protein S27E
MSKQTNESQPGDWFTGVECGNCGKTLRTTDSNKTAEGFRVTCDKCGHEQVYLLSDIKIRQAQC